MNQERKRAPKRKLYCPEDAAQSQRQAFGKWLRYHGEKGCWGIWIASKETTSVRLSAHMKRVRQDRRSRYFPKGTPERIQRRYYSFIYSQGRCTFAAWWKWQQGKGPRPLQYL